MSIRKLSVCIVIFLMLFVSGPINPSALTVNDAVFFGDSTTAHLAVRGGIPKNRVWSGPKSTVLFETVNDICCVHLADENINVTFREAVKRKKPKLLIITIGASGGAGFLDKSHFIQVYKDMLLSVKSESPSTKIIVQSIYPLSDKSVHHFKRLNQPAVNTANAWIASLCGEMEIPYLDTEKILKDPKTGYLKKEYQNDEQLHLTKAAYREILSYLDSAIARLAL